MENKFLNLDGLSTFLIKIKEIFATKEHTHTGYNKVVASTTQPEDLLPGDIWLIVKEK